MSAPRSALSYYTGSLVFTAICLTIGAILGFNGIGASGGFGGAVEAVILCAVLGVLEVSLSFDNAVVNAAVMRNMQEIWCRRFLTWGMIIAVFGMRLVFPLLIVAIAAGVGPIEALTLAVKQPEEYARILTDAHVGIAAFGGTFLAMVGIKFFFDADKEVHWIAVIEERLSRYAAIQYIEIGIVLSILVAFWALLPEHEGGTFLLAGVFGLITYIAVEILGHVMEASEQTMHGAAAGGFGMFMYLNVLDASFSFDGVIGAFALSTNLFIIALGLGIGAMFVRSMTIMLKDKGTLAEYRYLEHGAFWAILALALIMFLQTLVHIPEVITGLIGATLIGLSFLSSVAHKRREAAEGGESGEATTTVERTDGVEPATLA